MGDDLDDFLAWRKNPTAKDVVRWLRKMETEVGVDGDDQAVAHVAADEIERLRAEIAANKRGFKVYEDRCIELMICLNQQQNKIEEK